MLGVGCACGLSLREKRITIHSDALPSRKRIRYYDDESYKSLFGGMDRKERKEKLMDDTDGMGTMSLEEARKNPEKAAKYLDGPIVDET